MWIPRRSEGFLAVALVLTSIRAQADPPTPGTPDASTLAGPSAAPGSPDAPAVPRSPPAPTTPAASDSVGDPLASYREQFKLGMDRYRRGAMAEAIAYWEPIYRELGEEKGYRLAYDLGVAYQEFGDATRAAERLEAFLREVDARAGRHEELAAIVAREEGDAHARLARLLATKGRIRVDAGASPRAVRVDASEPRLSGFIAWVTPGVHRIVLGAGTPAAETRVVSVRAGEVIDVASPVPAAPPPSSAGIEPPPAAAPPSETRSPKAGDAPSDGAAAEAPPTGSASAANAHSAGPFPAVAGAAAPTGSG
jgi:hypothetical protein